MGDAYRKAMASMEIEGFKYTDEEREIFRKLDAGEMTDDEFRQIVNDKLTKLRIERPEIFATEEESKI